MSNPSVWLEELEETISSPAAAALREYVVSGDRANAIRIFMSERVAQKRAESLYDYCRELWSGVNVALVEITRADAAVALAAHADEAEKMNARKPRYVVRDGLRISESGAYLERGEWWVFLGDGAMVPLSRIKQLWHIQASNSALVGSNEPALTP